jgi:hypothetical protein
MSASISGELRNPQDPYDNRPCVRIKVAAFYCDSFAGKPEVDAVIDTGFAGLVIAPRVLMTHIKEECLVPVPKEKRPRYVPHGSKEAVPYPDTFQFIRIAVLNDDQGWTELQPEYVSFGETDHALIGVDLLIAAKALVVVDGQQRRFSMQF